MTIVYVLAHINVCNFGMGLHDLNCFALDRDTPTCGLLGPATKSVHTRMYIYTCRHICIYTYLCMMYMYVYIYIYIYIYICLYTYTYIYMLDVHIDRHGH